MNQSTNQSINKYFLYTVNLKNSRIGRFSKPYKVVHTIHWDKSYCLNTEFSITQAKWSVCNGGRNWKYLSALWLANSDFVQCAWASEFSKLNKALECFASGIWANKSDFRVTFAEQFGLQFPVLFCSKVIDVISLVCRIFLSRVDVAEQFQPP